jgi:heterodisulfide reductase subunit B
MDPEEIKSKVVKPLYGLRVAPYYGCLITRPGFNGNEDYDFPTSLDNLMKLIGADVSDFTLKTHCCGGHMTQISEPTALELIRRLLKNADDFGADAIVTLCPMCQLNLDAYQASVNKYFGTKFKIPIVYFTQLMGIALGLDPKELGIGKEFVRAKSIMSKITHKPLPSSKKKRPSKVALPMPSMEKEV